ncbi:Hypp3595 [Branchiostoma lanceolatum]|uniref:Hypp3595 protein n=1 Tax=Branchiostoma lanceolatum TaxID=7740 RepID=A0A8K0A088_BRALA|nr:Hypp3595 [Branchiostoma lanceolatum]
MEFNLLRQQIERLQGRSIEGIKDEILQLAARPLPAFDQNRAVSLLQTLASQARMQAHPKAEEFRYSLQQLPQAPLALETDPLLVSRNIRSIISPSSRIRQGINRTESGEVREGGVELPTLTTRASNADKRATGPGVATQS